jgi:hypothetical protein
MSARWRLLLAAATMLSALHSSAFVSNHDQESGKPLRWNLVNPGEPVHTNIVNRSTRAVRFFIGANAFSEANREAELNAVRACFDQWQSIPGTQLRFEEGGLIGGAVDVNTRDNTNLVYWARSSLFVNNGRDNIVGATGLTFWEWLSDGTITEVDIVLNGVQFSWFTDFNAANQGQFVEAVLLHEIGHLLGLAHSPVGAATMFWRASNGVSTQAGLAPDEISAVRYLYPAESVMPSLGAVAGRVTSSEAAVFGAVVSVEDSAGNMVAGTVTRANGQYELPALPPGNYNVRATPVDPAGSSYFLLRGRDISSAYSAAEPTFTPTFNKPAIVGAGSQVTLDLAVLLDSPAFRIGRIRPPTQDPAIFVVVNYPVTIRPGQSNIVVGVYGTDLPSSNATLRIEGGGITFGETVFKPNALPGLSPALNCVSVLISVASDAVPGMRSFVLQQGSNVAFVNGFLEIMPKVIDYNFDGLDDLYQRRHWPRWTCEHAAPDADPDGDGFTNMAEYIAGSDPTDPGSFLRVSSIRFDASGATVTWPSAPGKRYQVLSRPHLSTPRGWQPIGLPVTATANTAEFFDPTATSSLRFYRIQAVPEE